MPVEPTKNKLKRRASRCEDHRFDPSHGRELELKRNRGSLQIYLFFSFSFFVSDAGFTGEVRLMSVSRLLHVIENHPGQLCRVPKVCESTRLISQVH